MLRLLFCLALMTNSAYAEILNLNCVVTHNLTEVISRKIVIGETEKEKSFGQYEEFRFYVSRLGPDTIEVQALNLDEPSRSYATSNLIDPGSFVALSIWKREFLVDVKCSKI
jgi:hypothetical protein